MPKMVFKISGSVEPYSRDKLVKSCVDAGVSEEADRIADKVERELGDCITSREIRTVVLEELEKVNPEAASNWKYFDRVLKGRITFEKGKFVEVESGRIYLGREVIDTGRKGIDSVDEVRGIVRELEEDLEHGISGRTINGRTYILYMAVLRSKWLSKEEKEESLKIINEFRTKQGWKPYKPKKSIS